MVVALGTPPNPPHRIVPVERGVQRRCRRRVTDDPTSPHSRRTTTIRDPLLIENNRRNREWVWRRLCGKTVIWEVSEETHARLRTTLRLSHSRSFFYGVSWFPDPLSFIIVFIFTFQPTMWIQVTEWPTAKTVLSGKPNQRIKVIRRLENSVGRRHIKLV